MTVGSLLKITFWIELDDRGGEDAGLSGMDLRVSWDPAQAHLSDESQAELWIGGSKVTDDNQDLDSDGDWSGDYYVSDPPGPGVQWKITDWSTDTYLGEIPGTDGAGGTNAFPLNFAVTTGPSSVLFQGYQMPPGDPSIGSEGNPYPFAHLAFVLDQDLILPLDLEIGTIGQLNSPTNTVDRVYFDMIGANCGSPFPKDQAVSLEPGQVNEYVWPVGSLCPEPSALLLAALGLPALLVLCRRRR